MERQFAKQTESLEAIFDCLAEFAAAHGINSDITREVQFAVEEVFINMVRYNTDSRNDVGLSLSAADGVLRVSIADRDVRSYDPTQRPPVDTTREPHERTPGGLGVHLVRQLMDDVVYEYADRTAKITLIKRLEK